MPSQTRQPKAETAKRHTRTPVQLDGVSVDGEAAVVHANGAQPHPYNFLVNDGGCAAAHQRHGDGVQVGGCGRPWGRLRHGHVHLGGAVDDRDHLRGGRRAAIDRNRQAHRRHVGGTSQQHSGVDDAALPVKNDGEHAIDVRRCRLLRDDDVLWVRNKGA